MLLSVLPVLATWRTLERQGWTAGWRRRIATGALALTVSLLVIATYHLGYPEFHGLHVLLPVFGCGMLSLAYLLTGNPLPAVLGHIAMHVAAVMHGMESVLQLPPHY
ncbi:MAG TPA: hypothetical protein VFA07_19390 [Chthonomonadaceae bacterium]|nr:hypothetical protein [Chthonomonadaceae bacterium]